MSNSALKTHSKIARWATGIIGAGLLVLSVTGFFAWTGNDLATDYAFDVDDEQIDFETYVGNETVQASKELLPFENNLPAGPLVELTLRRLDLQAGKLTVDVYVNLPQLMFRVDPRDRFSEAAKFKVSYRSWPNLSLQAMPPPENHGDYTVTKTITLEGVAHQSNFPADTYYFGLRLYMGPVEPSSVSLRISPELSSLDVSARAGGPKSYYLVLRRDSETKWFTYSVALAPLILLVAILALPRQEVRTSVAGLAIGALAMLPLRQVLVPASISHRTTIDVLLACEFIFLLAIAAIVMAYTSGRPVETVPETPTPESAIQIRHGRPRRRITKSRNGGTGSKGSKYIRTLIYRRR